MIQHKKCICISNCESGWFSPKMMHNPLIHAKIFLTIIFWHSYLSHQNNDGICNIYTENMIERCLIVEKSQFPSCKVNLIVFPLTLSTIQMASTLEKISISICSFLCFNKWSLVPDNCIKAKWLSITFLFWQNSNCIKSYCDAYKLIRKVAFHNQINLFYFLWKHLFP